MKNNKVIGYGINHINACFRDGSSSSYDYFFNTLEEAQAFEDELYSSGYGDSYGFVTEVTLEDELTSHLRDYIQDDNYLTNEDIENILKHYKDRYGIEIDTKTWNSIIVNL